MSLIFHYHPLASFCWKALIALYEKSVPFEARLVNLGDPASRGAFQALWPMAKMPVLQDEARGVVVPESSIIIEYLDLHEPGPRMTPTEAEEAWRVRLWDRLVDSYIHDPMQRIVADRLRPAGQKDPLGVAQAKSLLETAYALLEAQLGDGWLLGESFGLADCAAAPALFYADRVHPIDRWPGVKSYLGRLLERPSFARVVQEAQPYEHMFPRE